MLSRSLTLRQLLVGLAVLGALTGCVTGKRPTLGAPLDPAKGIDRQATGIAAVDEVLVPLLATEGKTYQAKYYITPTSGRVAVEAVVAQQGIQRSVTIGEIRFLSGTEDLTCNLTKKTCELGLLDQRVSNVAGASHNFDRDTPAIRIRLAANAARTTLFPSHEGFELQTTNCVNFPNGKAADSYCVLPNGSLSRLARADTAIALQTFSDTVDATLFVRPDRA